MRSYRYLHLDVFTDRPLEGNQLAVFLQTDGLSTDEMQRMTKEMAFSECTFIFPAEPAGAAGDPPPTDIRMRIFTPGTELPLAGHPTIGSTFALAEEGIIEPGRSEFVFALRVGPIPVALEWKGSSLHFAWMTQPLPSFGGKVTDRGAFAAAIGVGAADFAGDLPIEAVSCGLPYLFAPLSTRAAVDRVVINRPAYVECCRGAGLEELPLFAFSLEAADPSGSETAYSRMLAPGFGVAEDPATGSASGPLGCYLAEHRVISRERLGRFVSLQGVAMGRPSRIYISIDQDGAHVRRVRVGGQSVLVGGGTLRF